MQKISLALALVLVLGCVSAIDFNSNSWNVQSKLVASNGTGDSDFLNKENFLVSSSANSTLSLLNNKDAATLAFNRRTFNVKDFGVNGNDSTVVLSTFAKGDKRTIIGDYIIAAGVIGTQPQQVQFIITPLNGGATLTYNVTKNVDNTTVYQVKSIFVHHNRYYVVYSNSLSNYSISGIDASGANGNTVALTNNATPSSDAYCVGLSGQESAYCIFNYLNGTVSSLFETTVGLKGSSDKAPSAKVFNTAVAGSFLPTMFMPYNAGKQYGALYQATDNSWFFKNNKNNTFSPLTPPVAGATLGVSFAYKDSLATFWSVKNTSTQLSNYTVEYIAGDSKLTNGSVVNNVTSILFTQYKDGSLYVVSQNASDIYLGQVWGSTGMSASALQSVFAIVLAAVAALFLF